MKSFGIKPHLKIITHEEEKYIYMNLKQNIEKFNQENDGIISVKIEQKNLLKIRKNFKKKG